MYAEAHLLTGDADRAITLFAEASTVAAALSNADPRIVSEAGLALLAMDRGRWAEAAEHTDIALAGIDERRMQDYPTCVLAFAAAARLAVHRGDLQEANRHLAAAMRVRPLLTFVLPIWAVRVRLQLARVYWAISERAAAHHLLREIDDILLHRPALGTLVDEISTFRQVITSSAQAAVSGAAPLSAAELRLLPYLQTHLTMGDIAGRLFVSRNTVSTQVGSIYRKLGVSSRSDAVQRATAIGLLGS